MENYKIASATRIGGRSENQDYYQIEETIFGLLAVVCDGMGGVNGGRIAAEMAVNKISEEIRKTRKNNPVDAIIFALAKANKAIFQESKNKRALRGMGTTVVVLLINEYYAICFHVGDSRNYQFRGNTILHRTFDHSEVFEQVSMGILTEEEARISPDSNRITRAIGIEPELEISFSEKLSYKKGDRFLLCTDGIWGAVPEIQLTLMISQPQPIEVVVNHLGDTIDQVGIENGNRHDNLTAVLIEMQNDSK